MAGEPGGVAGVSFVGGGGGHADVGGAGRQLAGKGDRSPPGSQMIVVLEVVIPGTSKLGAWRVPA